MPTAGTPTVGHGETNKFANPFDLTAPPLMTERFAATANNLYAMADTPPADAERANALPSAPRAALSG